MAVHARSRLRADLVRLTSALVETPTPTGSESALADSLMKALLQRGFEVWKQPTSDGRCNLRGARGKSSLLFSAHVDTFPAYTHPQPYRLVREKGTLVGRGVADCKGQIAALLMALTLTNAPVEVAFVVGEERNGLGSKELDITPEEVHAAVVLEPTQMQVIAAHAGAIEFEVTVYGRAAHGSVPHYGESAISKAIQLIAAIEQLPLLIQQTHPLFPPAPWVTVGKINGGFEPMVVPNKCQFQADVRVLPGILASAMTEQLRSLVAQFGAEFTLIDFDEPCEIPADSKVVRAVSEAHHEVTGTSPLIGGFYSWSDAVNYIAKGIPAVVYGAGNLGDAHSDHEWLSLRDLELLTQVYTRVIESWAE